MSLIYLKAAEKTLILSPREGYQRAFDFGTDWTQVRLGMYYGGVISSDPNARGPNESVTLNNAADYITFGLKNSSDTNFPGVAGTNFLGASSSTASLSNGEDYTNAAGAPLIARGWHGVTAIDSGNLEGMVFPTDITGVTGYCGFCCIKFVITNRGLANQQVAISWTGNQTIAGSDYSSAALRILMNNGSFSSPRTINWNDGSTAYPIPDAFYVRMPFYNNRIRISCMRASRYA